MGAHTLDSIATDILEEIFLTCVHWSRISPLTLAAVCRYWSDVALQCGRLWTDIDALKLEAAEIFVQRSQRADLDVVWCEDKLRQQGGAFCHNVVDDMPWLISQLDRFHVLAVHATSRKPEDILPIFSLPATTLPRLQALVLASIDEYGDMLHVEPGLLNLEVQMPCLRHVSLW